MKPIKGLFQTWWEQLPDRLPDWMLIRRMLEEIDMKDLVAELAAIRTPTIRRDFIRIIFENDVQKFHEIFATSIHYHYNSVINTVLNIVVSESQHVPMMMRLQPYFMMALSHTNGQVVAWNIVQELKDTDAVLLFYFDGMRNLSDKPNFDNRKNLLNKVVGNDNVKFMQAWVELMNRYPKLRTPNGDRPKTFYRFIDDLLELAIRRRSPQMTRYLYETFTDNSGLSEAELLVLIARSGYMPTLEAIWPAMPPDIQPNQFLSTVLGLDYRAQFVPFIYNNITSHHHHFFWVKLSTAVRANWNETEIIEFMIEKGFFSVTRVDVERAIKNNNSTVLRICLQNSNADLYNDQAARIMITEMLLTRRYRIALVLLEFYMVHLTIDFSPSITGIHELDYVIEDNQIDIIRAVLWNVQWDAENSHYLFLAARFGRHEILSTILYSDLRYDLAKDGPAMIPMVVSSKQGSIETMKLLLARPEIDPTMNNNVALTIAVDLNHVSMTELLLSDYRIRANVDPSLFQTLIQKAQRRNNAGLVALLSAYAQHANDPSPSFIFRNNLRDAIARNRVEDVRQLLDSVPLNGREAQNTEALFMAASYKSQDVIFYLIGIENIDLMAGAGGLLSILMRHDMTDILERLLVHPRVLDRLSQQRAKQLMVIAQEKGNERIQELLQRYLPLPKRRRVE